MRTATGYRNGSRAMSDLLEGRLAVSVREFCELTGSSKSYFYSLSETDRPKMVKRGGRFFIPVAEVHRFLGGDND